METVPKNIWIEYVDKVAYGHLYEAASDEYARVYSMWHCVRASLRRIHK
jgi:hypothetical protein